MSKKKAPRKTTIDSEFPILDVDDESTVTLKVRGPLPAGEAALLMADFAQRYEETYVAYLERTTGRQMSFAPLAEVARGQGWRDREPAMGGLPKGDR
jgi:hypothetical protein